MTSKKFKIICCTPFLALAIVAGMVIPGMYDMAEVKERPIRQGVDLTDNGLAVTVIRAGGQCVDIYQTDVVHTIKGWKTFCSFGPDHSTDRDITVDKKINGCHAVDHEDEETGAVRTKEVCAFPENAQEVLYAQNDVVSPIIAAWRNNEPLPTFR